MHATLVHEETLAGFRIAVYQHPKTRRFSVSYGKQLNCDLTYVEAAKEFGIAVFHAATCEGKIKEGTR